VKAVAAEESLVETGSGKVAAEDRGAAKIGAPEVAAAQRDPVEGGALEDGVREIAPSSTSSRKVEP
jgi:hypothetical protein